MLKKMPMVERMVEKSPQTVANRALMEASQASETGSIPVARST